MRPTTAAALALAALLTPATAAAADLAFTLEHNLGPGGGWTRAGALSGDLAGALAAAKAGRGVVPALTLTRAATSLTRGEQDALDDLVRRDGLYTVRATAEKAGEAHPTATAVAVARPPVPLVASAPARCVAAAGGDAPLKLDGALTLSSRGDWASPAGLEVTGLTFDFHALRCADGSGHTAPAPAAWAPPATAPVPLWLPAAAPPVLPAPTTVTPGGRPAGAASAPLAPGGGGGGGSGGGGSEGGGGEDGQEDARPDPPKRTNWIFILPLAMLVVNLMNAVAPPPATMSGGGGGGGGRGPRRAG